MKPARLTRLFGCLLLGGAVWPAFSAAAVPCAALAGFALPGHAVEIDRAERMPAGPMTEPAAGPPGPPGAPGVSLPAHCRVDGAIDRRIGRNGKPYAIGFAIALPEQWNGRFLFQGGGGLNGSVSPPVGMQFAGEQPALAQGYAVISTDSGHTGSTFDASFFEDQEAALNFLYQAVGKVTVVGKEILARHYGKPSDFAYFVGCSTGGREAMILSQRYPRHFDGIVAGAPAMRTNFSNLGLRIGVAALDQIAPRDAQGRPQTRQALSDADRQLVVDRLLQACDALDGAEDGLVFALQDCEFDPAVLACSGDRDDACLTMEQVAAVKVVMGEKRASDGRQVYPGYFYDTGIIATRGLPGLLAGAVIPEEVSQEGPFDIDVAAAAASNARAWAGDTNGWTNLSTFQGHGSKLIFFHGVSDPWFSAIDTVQYYEQMAQDTGPVPVDEWSRLFLVPGMTHCGGGESTDRFDMLTAIQDWVEKDQAPDRIVASGNAFPGVTRPLCPYPAVARYTGGDPASAATDAATTASDRVTEVSGSPPVAPPPETVSV